VTLVVHALVLINIDSNMHGDEIKIVSAKQARQFYIFKNTKRKLLRTNAAICKAF